MISSQPRCGLSPADRLCGPAAGEPHLLHRFIIFTKRMKSVQKNPKTALSEGRVKSLLNLPSTRSSLLVCPLGCSVWLRSCCSDAQTTRHRPPPKKNLSSKGHNSSKDRCCSGPAEEQTHRGLAQPAAFFSSSECSRLTPLSAVQGYANHQKYSSGFPINTRLGRLL